MPFDGSDFPPRREPSGPPAPSDTLVCVFIAVVATALLVLPVSLDALVDVGKYLQTLTKAPTLTIESKR